MSNQRDIDPDATSYYARLGVEADANSDELDRRWKEAQARYHPDAGGDEEDFRRVRRAHQVLSTTELRAEYDRFLEVWNSEGGTLCFEEQDARGGQFDPNACEELVSSEDLTSSSATSTSQSAETAHSETGSHASSGGRSGSRTSRTRSSSRSQSNSSTRTTSESGPSVAILPLLVHFAVRIGIGAVLAAGLLHVPGPHDQFSDASLLAIGVITSFGMYQVGWWVRRVPTTTKLSGTVSGLVLIGVSLLCVALLGPLGSNTGYFGLEYLLRLVTAILFIAGLFGILGALVGAPSSGAKVGLVFMLGYILFLPPGHSNSYVSLLRSVGIDPYPIVPQIDFVLRVSVFLNAAAILAFYAFVGVALLFAAHILSRRWVTKAPASSTSDYIAVPTFSDVCMGLPLALIGYGLGTNSAVRGLFPASLGRVTGTVAGTESAILLVLVGCIMIGVWYLFAQAARTLSKKVTGS